MRVQIIFIFLHYAFIGAIAVISYVFGKRILIRVIFDSIWEDLLFSSVLGIGFISYLVFLLGILHILYAWLVSIILASMFLISIFSWSGLLVSGASLRDRLTGIRDAIKCRMKYHALLIVGILALFILLSGVLPLYPPTAWDATEYHLALSKIYVNAHGLILTEYLRFPVNPQLSQMLFTLALLLYDDISAQLVQYLSVLLVAVAVCAFCVRYFNTRAGILGAALWLSNPLVLWTGSVAYIDGSLALFMTSALFAFFNYFNTQRREWIVLSGVFTGFAIATKYPALVFVFVFGLVFLITGIIHRDWRLPVIFGVITFIVGSPFYLRDFLYSGNPFFPFFANIFPTKLWNQIDINGLAQEQNSHGLAKTFLSFIKLPWYLISQDNIFLSEVNGYTAFNPIFIYLLPITFLLAIRDRTVQILLALILLLTSFWFVSVQVLRYLLPVFPLLSVTSAVSIERTLTEIWHVIKARASRLKIGVLFEGALSACCAAIIMFPMGQYAVQIRSLRGRIPTTPEQRDAYLMASLPSYPAYKFLNRRSGSDYAVYALLDENMTYFANGRFMGDWFGPARFSEVLSRLSNGEDLYQYLKQLGANYFLVTTARMKIKLPNDAEFAIRFKRIYRSNGIIVFELVPGP
jgi:4-amino-4-deoxy-L-arabinose transferase-like glycosyltransferase